MSKGMHNKRRRRNVSPNFEERWKERFKKYADYHNDDAGIAGWSESGLESRFRYFTSVWRQDRTLLSDRSPWLDAGCGAGTYTRFLSAEGCRVVGLDYSYGSIRKARGRSQVGIVWVVADVRRLPIKPDSFDGAICFGVTQALSDSEHLIKQLASSVTEGGEVWLDVLNAWCLPNLWDIIKRKLRRRTYHVRYESPRLIKQLFIANGLTDVKAYWVPVVPRRLQSFMKYIDTPFVRILFDRIPGLGILLCHSMLIKGCKKGSYVPEYPGQ